MPPKLALSTPRMSTRPKNKDAHPGLVDLPSPRRQAPESEEQHQKAAEEQAAEEKRCTKSAMKAAQLQDQLRREDQAKVIRRQTERDENTTTDKLATLRIDSASNKEKRNAANAQKDKGIKFVSDNDASDTGTGTLAADRKKRAAAVRAKAKSSASKSICYQSSSGTDGSDFEEKSGESESESAESEDGDESDEDLEETDKKNLKKRKKKSKSKVSPKKKARKNKKKRHADTEAMRETSDATGTPVIINKRKVTEVGDAGGSRKKKKTDEIHGLDPEWQEFAKKYGKAKTNRATGAADDDHMVQFGGMISDGETDEIEAKAMKAMTKSLVKPKTNQYVALQLLLNQRRLNKRALGALAPWDNITVDHVKEIVDEIFGKDTYRVDSKGAWMGLVTACMHNYRNGFAKYAMETVDLLITGNHDQLQSTVEEENITIEEAIANKISDHLQKEPIRPDSELCTFAFHWDKWSPNPAERKGFGLNQLVLRTFALAHLAYLDGIDDFTAEKPVGALIYSMQAIGRALEHWKSGKKSDKKPPPFSSDNFGDKFEDVKGPTGLRGKVQKTRIRKATIFVDTLKDLKKEHWDTIIDEGRVFLQDIRKKVRDRASSATVVEDLVQDPDGGFKLVLN
ncbi:hypothetical protein M378DRAFT_182088 [Amanita muscaria Koide BX008]|uniref:Uncharacterized protein n=1 Tax=Amanita muscaria (strain Koide BX008) TaxID=946122 RepID=A0A0C2S021_AMAMK|nr:hypothetical protein M378DRAFT_182088 [Amanita muscaria Koide BX008]